MQTNPADKLCLQKIRQKLGQNADKSCRQTLSAKNPPKPGSKCRQILQTNLVKTENCRQLQKKCRQSLSSIVRKGLSILDKLCLYPKILELALSTFLYLPNNRIKGCGWDYPFCLIFIFSSIKRCVARQVVLVLGAAG